MLTCSQLIYFFVSLLVAEMAERKPRPLTPIKNYINRTVTKFREDNGYNQTDLASWMGAPKSLVSHVEGPNKQNKYYTLEHISSLSFFLDIPLGVFLPEKGLDPNGTGEPGITSTEPA